MKKFLSWGVAFLLGVSMFWVYTSPTRAESMGQGTCPWDAAWSRGYDPSGLIGALVLGQDFEELGRVVGVTGSPNGGINFLIVSSCLPGMSERLVAIPYRSFNNYGGQIDHVTLNLSTEDFENAPNFSRGSWPANWAQKSYRYFEKIG